MARVADNDEDHSDHDYIYVKRPKWERIMGLVKELAEMPMPESGPGTAWPTEYCPFCKWAGEADKMIPDEEQTHEEDCPVAIARKLANPDG